MNFTAEQVKQGKENFQRSLGINRRDFLKTSAAVPGLAAVGAVYFGYGTVEKPVRAGIVGVGAEGRQAMIEQSPPDYLEYVAYHDIRPYSKYKVKKSFETVYGGQWENQVKLHEKWEDMLADPNIEAIVIATPLWTHAKFAIEAMEAGKHVLCEKLMAGNITDAKAMVRASEKYNKKLSIGHQRHYSTLYDDALHIVRSGQLGEIRHINAFWHRNNTHLDPKTGEIMDAWKPKIIPDDAKGTDWKAAGYQSMEELVRWRLFNRTGGGLMAELGSHQLDACSIFLGKMHPLAVRGIGGIYFYEDDREAEDHVYCTYEFPAIGQPDSKDTKVIVTYSSINTNSLSGYGEVVMGTKGTMAVINEKDVLLLPENDRWEKEREMYEKGVRVQSQKGSDKEADTSMYSSPGYSADAESVAGTGGPRSRGYREELEHFAFCIRNPDAKVRCDGNVALADAVMALTANISMRANPSTRIEFKDAWYDPKSDETPDAKPKNMELAKKV